MSEGPPVSGWFVAIVGPSGAGKDTILRGAKEALGGDPTFSFPQRTITRAEGDDTEDHLPVSEAEFIKARQAGAFCVSWSAHGLYYGIPASARAEYTEGRIVVANVSRSALGELRRLFDTVRVVQITVDREVLAERLRLRARESAEEIRARLSRIDRYTVKGADVVTLDNSGDPAVAISDLIAVLKDLAARDPRPADRSDIARPPGAVSRPCSP